MKNKLKLHPQSLKSIKAGHPWITKDSFSEKFPQQLEWLEFFDERTKGPLGVFFHDPQHPSVKARFWDEKMGDFKQQLEQKLRLSIEKRKKLTFNRENIFYVFGEGDALAGLYVIQLNDHLLVQFQSFFWEKHLSTLLKKLRIFFPKHKFWYQKRLPGVQKVPPQKHNERTPEVFQVLEQGIKYEIRMNLNHDIGLYTDMSFIREKVKQQLKKQENFLNLFSYTGAFSLQALAEGLHVTSVDSSSKYMSWLEQNLEINQLGQNHRSLVKESKKALLSFKENNELFDWILCDPPSSFTQQKKRISSKQFYQESIELMYSLVKPNGHLVVFMNTHNFTRGKFKNFFKELLGNKIKPQDITDLKMGDDCPIYSSFPEGDHIKGLLIKKSHE